MLVGGCGNPMWGSSTSRLAQEEIRMDDSRWVPQKPVPVPTGLRPHYKTIARASRSLSCASSTLPTRQPRRCLRVRQIQPLSTLETPTLPTSPQRSFGWSIPHSPGTTSARSSTVRIPPITQPDCDGHSYPRPGIVIVLYFQTIAALVSPLNRKGEKVKWGLVGYSTVMFGLATTFTAMNVRLQQLSYIDNREFPGIPNVLPPGPIGWSLFMYSKALVIVPNACFIIANWMADGLLVSSAPVYHTLRDTRS